ncbi:anti-sigma factor [Pedobacter ginsengisoli]|uniref:Anti-sigma factor n=1 Tax=Pedobacter ginsengisoli TaxID=363852 RepID=A0A2D1U253_9SPHI|nr:FecR family protein [Pedobacter ginsengisoli]ATP55669.1 anti-sigma factor [Pedobacter ginsengisoli]
MNRTRFHILLQYFKEDVISEEEWRELLGMVKTGRYDDQLEDDLLISLDSIGKKNKWTEDIEREMWLGIQTKIQGQSKNTNYRIWIAAAAVLLVMLTAGLLFFKAEHLSSSLKTNTARIEADILPGGNKAVLTLPDGKRVVLTDSTIKQLANQAGGSITKAGNGILVYNMTSLAGNAGAITGKEIFNTISTPRGGQYQVILADGTHVWLNAASSLKFPASFKGKTRLVELTGEAYFEVAKNKQMPFIVHTQNQEVEVLGTHFNISSYDDEKVTKTTLLEGSVKVIAQANQKVIKPGEQAQINRNVAAIKVLPVSIEEAIAWKNGYFVFNDEKLESIMQRVSRWYDIDYEFQGQQGNLSFLGVVERSKNISSLLKVLESTGNVHFKIEGRKIIVMP